MDGRIAEYKAKLTKDSEKLLLSWDGLREAYSGDSFVYKVRDKEFKVALVAESLAGTKIPKVMVPNFTTIL